MTAKEITAIRLKGWGQRLQGEGATPVVMISVVIEGKNTGKIIISATEDTTNDTIIALLESCLSKMVTGEV